MASGDMVCVESIIRGHHIYKSIWNPIIGEELEVYREPDNVHDRRAVCVKKSGAIVGHVPCEISRVLGKFIRHGGTVSCRVSGSRQLGHGLEVPCTYVLAGKKKLVAKVLKNLTIKHIAYTCT